MIEVLRPMHWDTSFFFFLLHIGRSYLRYASKCGCLLFYLLSPTAWQNHTGDMVTEGLVNDTGEHSLFSLHPSTHKSYVQHGCLLSNGFSTFFKEIVFLIIPPSVGKQPSAQSRGIPRANVVLFCPVLGIFVLCKSLERGMLVQQHKPLWCATTCLPLDNLYYRGATKRQYVWNGW